MTTYLIEKLSLDLVKKIEKMKTEMEYDPLKHTYTEFAIKGCLEGIQWLHYKRIEGCTHWAMEEAASNGHLEVVKWLHSNRSEGCTFRACLSSVNIWLKCKLNRIKTFIYTFINNYRKQTEME
jgi:hypothetical protein